MSQRLVINLKNGTGYLGKVKKALFNADDIFYAAHIPSTPPNFDDGQYVRLYTSEGKYFVLTCTSESVTSDVVLAINEALSSNPGGRVVEAQTREHVLTVSSLIEPTS